MEGDNRHEGKIPDTGMKDEAWQRFESPCAGDGLGVSRFTSSRAPSKKIWLEDGDVPCYGAMIIAGIHRGCDLCTEDINTQKCSIAHILPSSGPCWCTFSKHQSLLNRPIWTLTLSLTARWRTVLCRRFVRRFGKASALFCADGKANVSNVRPQPHLIHPPMSRIMVEVRKLLKNICSISSCSTAISYTFRALPRCLVSQRK